MKSKYKPFFTVTLALLAVLFLLQAAFSYLLQKKRTKIITYLNNTFGYRFDLKRVSFSFLGGLHLGEFSVFFRDQERPPIFIKDAFIKPGILALLLRNLVIRIHVTEAVLLASREEEGINLQIIFSDIYKKVSEKPIRVPIVFKPAIEMTGKNVKFTYISNPILEKKMHIAMQNCRLYQELTIGRFSGDMDFMYQLEEGASVFKGSRIAQKIKFAMQTRIKDKDLYMDYITLNVEASQIIGSGVNRNFAERNPGLDVNFSFAAFLLEDFASLKNTFDAQGTAVILFAMNGPMDNIKPTVLARLYDCRLKYPLPDNKFIEIERLNADIQLRDKLISVKNSSLGVENMAVNIGSLIMNASPYPDISLQLSLPQEFLTEKGIPLDKVELTLNGKITDSLSGNLKINALYLRKDSTQNMEVNFNGLNLDYKNPRFKYFGAQTINLIKDNSYRAQRLNFKDLSSKVYLGKSKLAIKDLNILGYNAALNGEMALDYGNKPALAFKLKGIGLDVKTLVEDMNITDKLLSGSLEFGISFDNRQNKFLEGECKIKDGLADLGAIAQIIQLPALSNMQFNSMDASFFITKEKVRVDTLKLSNPEVLLQASWDTDGEIDGRMNLGVTSRLLKQSYPFRKLLELSQLKKDYVDFDFLLKGGPRNPRVMWLKGEFKDKLKENISGWVERKIEEEIDRVINSLSDQ